MIAGHHLNAVDFYSNAPSELVQPPPCSFVFGPLPRLSDIPSYQNSVSNTTSYFSDNFACVSNQLLLNVSMDMDPIILFLTKMNIGYVNENCWHKSP